MSELLLSDYIKDWEDNNYQMSKQMYPFNENYGDTKEVKSFSQTLMEGIPFYAVNYKNLIVSLKLKDQNYFITWYNIMKFS